MLILNIPSISVQASATPTDINLPTYDCDLGFIFETDGTKYNNTTPDEYEGVVVVFGELNLYFASSLDNLKAISGIFNIVSWEKNYKIEMPEDLERDINIDDVLNTPLLLFSEKEKQPLTVAKIQCDRYQKYTGDPITPEIILVHRTSGVTLIKDVDYTIEYSDNIEIGEATFCVKGIGEYKGTVYGHFEITETGEPLPTPTEEPIAIPILSDYVSDPWFEWQWYYDSVHARAYQDNNITGEGVKIGIIDDGFTCDLDDFNYNNIKMINVVAYVYNKEERLDVISGEHGTYVSSVIAAQTDNNTGIAGMTENVYLNIYDIADGDSSPTGYTSLDGAAELKSLEMAYKDGCDVINMSFGSPISSSAEEKYDPENYSDKIFDYIASKGIIAISSNGNWGEESLHDSVYRLNCVTYPACCTNVIGVVSIEPIIDKADVRYDSATRLIYDIKYDEPGSSWLSSQIYNKDVSYKKSSFSSANKAAFVSAPGREIAVYNTDSSYKSASGTSFAAPIVSAAAIGVKQMRPYVDTNMFKEILKATSVDLDEPGYDVNTGWGMVDFQAIYDYVSQMPETIPMTTPEIEIDYENGILKGFQGKYNYENYKLQNQVSSEYEYYVNGEKITPNYPEIAPNTTWNNLLNTPIGEIPIDESWYGKDISIVVKSKGEGFTDSEPQILSVPALPETIKEDTSNIEVDYKKSVLKCFSDDKAYQINGEAITTLNGEYVIPEGWFGTTISIQVKATEQYHIDSEIQELAIPAIPEAPKTTYNIIYSDEGSISYIDGITEKMEFRQVGTNEWRTGIITSAGEYEIRYKATETSFPSITYTVKFEDKEPEIPTVHEYDVETSVSYENCTIRYEYTNFLEDDISAVGIVAVYDKNNSFIGMHTINGLKPGTNSDSFNMEGNVGNVKFFAWKDMSSLQPYEKAQLSTYQKS